MISQTDSTGKAEVDHRVMHERTDRGALWALVGGALKALLKGSVHFE